MMSKPVFQNFIIERFVTVIALYDKAEFSYGRILHGIIVFVLARL